MKVIKIIIFRTNVISLHAILLFAYRTYKFQQRIYFHFIFHINSTQCANVVNGFWNGVVISHYSCVTR